MWNLPPSTNSFFGIWCSVDLFIFQLAYLMWSNTNYQFKWEWNVKQNYNSKVHMYVWSQESSIAREPLYPMKSEPEQSFRLFSLRGWVRNIFCLSISDQWGQSQTALRACNVVFSTSGQHQSSRCSVSLHSDMSRVCLVFPQRLLLPNQCFYVWYVLTLFLVVIIIYFREGRWFE